MGPGLVSQVSRATGVGLACLIAGLVAGLATAGCATERVVQMDPLTFTVVDQGDGKSVEALDPEILFGDGNRAFEAQDFALAAKKYALLVDKFPASRFAVVAGYNAGLALEKSGRPREAIPRYQAVAAKTAGSKDAQDALFRIAACAETLEDWKSMWDIGNQLVAPYFKDVGLPDRIAALAVRGRAAEGLGNLALAERDYRAALELYQKNLGVPALDMSPFVSLAQFRIAEIYRDLFASIHFKLPPDRMARDLEDKSNFFLMSQNGYLRVLRLHHSEWAVIAGYRLGALYEVMYEDMLAAEVPTDLTQEEIEIYYDELKGKIRPLLERAIDIYERNLRLGQRFGKRDDWMKKTEASLARLKDVLRAESSRAAESQLKPLVRQP